MKHSTKPDFTAASVGKATKPTLYPLSFRVTAEEKERITSLANGRSVSAYVRDAALNKKTKRRSSDISIKADLSARLLGALGQSELFSSLSKMAEAAESGSLPLYDETIEQIETACTLVIAIRRDLIEALGIEAED